MSDAPIEPQDYLYGVKVVQIEDLRVARGLTRRPTSTCSHKALVYDDKERRIWCSDCEQEIEPFDAFIGLCGVFSAGVKDLNSRRRKLAEAEAFQLRSRAAKAIDEAWRRRNTVPCCPSCSAGLLPEDFAGGIMQTRSAEFERARRKRT